MALIAGVLLGLLIWFASPLVVARMTEPAVAVHAVTYLRCRCLAAPALLGVYVATGSFRGHKNTRQAPEAITFKEDLFILLYITS